jgi:serine/threonine protein kinase
MAINQTLMKINHPYIAKIYSSNIINSYSLKNSSNVKVCLQVIMELGVCTLENVIKKRSKEKKSYSEVEIIKIMRMLI